MRRNRALTSLLFAAAGGITGCGTLLGLDDFTDQPEGSATTGAGGAGSTSTSASTAASGGGGASASTGQGGTGGATFCEPGMTMPCYTGPVGTEGVGLCAAGEATCLQDGSAYGACSGDVLPAVQDDCATQQDENCDGYQCGEAVWAAGFGDAYEQYLKGTNVDSFGNVFMAGDFGGSMTLGGLAPLQSAGLASTTFWAKTDASGTPVKATQFGGASGQFLHSLGVAPGGDCALFGSYAGTTAFGPTVLQSAGDFDHFLVLLDPGGTPQWAKGWGDAGPQFAAGDVAALAGGDVVFGGSLNGTADLGDGPLVSAGSSDAVVARFAAADGSLQWRHQWGDASTQSVSSVKSDAAGNVLVAGLFQGTMAISGIGNLSAQAQATFVAKLDSLGAAAFARSIPAALGGVALTIGPGGEIIVAGIASAPFSLDGISVPVAGPSDVVLILLNPFGFATGAKVFPGPAFAVAIASGANGDMLLAVEVSADVDFGGGVLPATGGKDVVLARCDLTGNHIWSIRTQGALTQYMPHLATAPNDAGWIVGLTSDSPFSLSGAQFSAGGSFDIAIAKLAP
jgi:hypothetical protein